jgi:ribosomal protein S18 acetylase RimI-like enzyme
MVSSLEIRLVGPESFEAMATVWKRAQGARNAAAAGATDVLEILRERLSKDGAWFAAGYLDGSIVTMAHGLQGRERDGEGEPIPGLMHFAMIAVEPAYWGRGYGRKMVELAIARGRDFGFETIQLWTQLSNERARRLYQSFGFVATDRTKEYAGESIGLYVLPLRTSG